VLVMQEREAIIVFTFRTTPEGEYPERFTTFGDRVWAREAQPEELDEESRGIKWWIRPVNPADVEWAEDAARPDYDIGVRQGDIVWAEDADWA
jgi:hypothetical protein